MKQSQSTSEEVRELLGEPEEIRSETTYDLWKYTFSKSFKSESSFKSVKALEAEIIFENGIMSDYKITVVTKTIPEDEKRLIRPDNDGSGIKGRSKAGYGNERSGGQRLNPKARRFLAKFDSNNDNKITIKEYSGPQEMFKRIDSNHDNIIELSELKHFPNKKN